MVSFVLRFLRRLFLVFLDLALILFRVLLNINLNISDGLRTIEIYRALKLRRNQDEALLCLRTIEIYRALKPGSAGRTLAVRLRTIWIYMALKQAVPRCEARLV